MAQVAKVWTPERAGELGQRFEGAPPQEVLSWALREFHPDIALACSFGAEDVVLTDMLWRINPQAKVFYIDTGFLFPESIQVRDRLAAKYGGSFTRVAPPQSLARFIKEQGDGLWSRDPDRCCNLRKVEPLRGFLAGLSAWVTGIRREQAPTRANAKVVEWDGKFNMAKVNPLVGWSWAQVWDYIHQHDVPYCELHDQDYPSIGCAPCTRQVKRGEDPRAGRWSGTGKIECGLHK